MRWRNKMNKHKWLKLFLVAIIITAIASLAVMAKSKNEAVQCPAVLKDYELRAYVTREEARKEGALQTFNIHINDEVGELYSMGSWKRFRDGSQVVLNDALLQDGAGGVLAMDFDFNRGCSRNYNFQIHGAVNIDQEGNGPNFNQQEWTFTINNEDFIISKGERHILDDGSKVILVDTLEQDLAGGLN